MCNRLLSCLTILVARLINKNRLFVVRMYVWVCGWWLWVLCFGAVVGTMSIKQLTRSSHQMHTGNQFNYSCYRYRTGSKIILCWDESHPTEFIFFSLVLHCGGGVNQNRNHICISRRRESITFVAVHSVTTTRFKITNIYWTDYNFVFHTNSLSVT